MSAMTVQHRAMTLNDVKSIREKGRLRYPRLYPFFQHQSSCNPADFTLWALSVEPDEFSMEFLSGIEYLLFFVPYLHSIKKGDGWPRFVVFVVLLTIAAAQPI